MKSAKWRVLATMVTVLAIAVVLSLRQLEAAAQARLLARAVRDGNHPAAADLLVQGADPDVMVAAGPDPSAVDRLRYRSLLLLAVDRGDRAMALLLKGYGASARIEPRPALATHQRLRKQIRPVGEMTPQLRPQEQVARRLEWNYRPEKVDLDAERHSLWNVALARSLLSLIGAWQTAQVADSPEPNSSERRIGRP